MEDARFMPSHFKEEEEQDMAEFNKSPDPNEEDEQKPNPTEEEEEEKEEEKKAEEEDDEGDYYVTAMLRTPGRSILATRAAFLCLQMVILLVAFSLIMRRCHTRYENVAKHKDWSYRYFTNCFACSTESAAFITACTIGITVCAYAFMANLISLSTSVNLSRTLLEPIAFGICCGVLLATGIVLTEHLQGKTGCFLPAVDYDEYFGDKYSSSMAGAILGIIAAFMFALSLLLSIVQMRKITPREDKPEKPEDEESKKTEEEKKEEETKKEEEEAKEEKEEEERGKDEANPEADDTSGGAK